jgi:hypothetical protein
MGYLYLAHPLVNTTRASSRKDEIWLKHHLLTKHNSLKMNHKVVKLKYYMFKPRCDLLCFAFSLPGLSSDHFEDGVVSRSQVALFVSTHCWLTKTFLGLSLNKSIPGCLLYLLLVWHKLFRYVRGDYN